MTPVDSPCDSILSSSANLIFEVLLDWSTLVQNSMKPAVQGFTYVAPSLLSEQFGRNSTPNSSHNNNNNNNNSGGQESKHTPTVVKARSPRKLYQQQAVQSNVDFRDAGGAPSCSSSPAQQHRSFHHDISINARAAYKCVLCE